MKSHIERYHVFILQTNRNMSTSTSSEISLFRPAGRVDCEIAIGTLPFLYGEMAVDLDCDWPRFFLTKLREDFSINRVVCIGSDAEYFGSRLPQLQAHLHEYEVDLIRLPVFNVSAFAELSLSNLRSLSSLLSQSNVEIGRTLLLCTVDGQRSTTLAGIISICLGLSLDAVLPRLKALRSSAFESPKVESFLRSLHDYVDEQRNTADSITWEFKSAKVFHAGNAADFFSSSEMDIILSSDKSLEAVELTPDERHQIANSTYEINLDQSQLAKQLDVELKPLYIEPGSHSNYLRALLPAAMDIYDSSAGFVTYVVGRPEGVSDIVAAEYIDTALRRIQGLMEALGLFCATGQIHYRSAFPSSRKRTTRAIMAGPMRSSRAAEFALMYKIDGFLFSGMNETSRYVNCRVKSQKRTDDIARKIIY